MLSLLTGPIFLPLFLQGRKRGRAPFPFRTGRRKGQISLFFPRLFRHRPNWSCLAFFAAPFSGGGRALRLEGSLALPWEPLFRGESSREPLFLTQFTHFFPPSFSSAHAYTYGRRAWNVRPLQERIAQTTPLFGRGEPPSSCLRNPCWQP